MQEDIKNLRVQIDGLAQLAKELKPIGDKVMVSDSHITENEDGTKDMYIGSKEVLVNTSNSKEIEKCVDSLYLTKAWLGKLFGELGTANPYGSGYKTKEDIVPTQDVASLESIRTINNGGLSFEGKEFGHIEKVDWLRVEIQALAEKVKTSFPDTWTKDIGMARTNTLANLSEARFWLGFELERVKNEN